jgi:L-ribulose-5-phosphate 3-epimerase UlaE
MYRSVKVLCRPVQFRGVLFGEGKVQYGDVWYRTVTVKLRLNLLTEVEPILEV